MSSSSDTTKKGFRPDIEGLRAVAILAVLAFHSGIPGFGGGFIGVDVFFVISGFPITGLLVRQLTSPGPTPLRTFYARRVRRLVPAALLVLLITAVAARLLVPAIEWPRTGWDIVWAAAYMANFAFAVQATEYLGEGLAASPVQHYWSLGVEEQFYLVWPLLILTIVALTRRRGRTARSWLVAALAALTAGSFTLSVVLTTSSPIWAFFAPWSRAWQFGVGGLIALAPWHWLGRSVRWSLSFAGMALILSGVVLIGAATPYPGWWALVPTLGSAALIMAGSGLAPGRSTPPGPVGALLRSRAATAIGRVSYSWYLWHWPPIAIITMVIGPWPWQIRTLVVLGTWVPAYLSYRYVETPLRLPEGALRGLRRPALVGSLAAAMTGAAAIGLLVLAPRPVWAPEVVPQAESEFAAPHRLRPSPAQPGAVRPAPAEARDDLPAVYADGCHADFEVIDPPACEFGVPRDRADATVVLLGDSHAAQWFPALHAAAAERSWHLVAMTKSGCPVADVTVWNSVTRTVYDDCDRYRLAALARIERLRPDVVVAAEYSRGYSLDGDGRRVDHRVWVDGLNRTLARIRGGGAAVALLADTPRPGFDVPACLSRHADRPDTCGFDRAGALDPREWSGVREDPDIWVVDLNDGICGVRRCPPIVANWLAYRDEHHLTASFARAFSDALADALPVGSAQPIGPH